MPAPKPRRQPSPAARSLREMHRHIRREPHSEVAPAGAIYPGLLRRRHIDQWRGQDLLLRGGLDFEHNAANSDERILWIKLSAMPGCKA